MKLKISHLPATSILLILTLLLSACGNSKDSTVVLRLGHALDSKHAVHKGMVHMAEQLKQYSGGRMRIEIYPSGQLGSERELIELLQIGSLAMTKVSASPMESFVPEMKVFSVPYIFRDKQHYWKVLESDIGKSLLEAPESVRLRGLTYYDAGSRSFYTNEHQIKRPDDLDGLKIRVMNSQTAIRMVESLGAAATPLAFGELYTALQQGVVNGAENNPPSFYLSRHYETSRYYSLDEHTSVPDILLISEHVWQKLNTEQRQWLQQAADDSSKYQRRLWAEATSEALEAVKAAGVEVVYPDKQPFREAVKTMQLSYNGTKVGNLIQQIQAVR